MKEYRMDPEYIYSSASTTKGTQIKYKKDGYFYKIDKTGQEGFVEYLATVVLNHSTLDEGRYVSYECCKINGKNGCRSRDFLKDKEEFITVHSLYQKLTGNSNLTDHLMTKRNAKERLEVILALVDGFGISIREYRNYLNVLMQLDLLIANTDRHVHNYGIIFSENEEFRIAPIFDNGRSLNTDRSMNFAACTLSGSFEEQVTAFQYPVEPCFQIDYGTLEQELEKIKQECGDGVELRTLRERLTKYEDIFRM